jgi:hypothetical protein
MANLADSINEARSHKYNDEDILAFLSKNPEVRDKITTAAQAGI